MADEQANRDYYVNFDKDWEEAVEFGFFGVDGGPQFTNGLNRLQLGDRIWVYYPKDRGFSGQGYVGVGRVVSTAYSAHGLKQKHPELNMETYADDAYVTDVKWEHTVTLADAIWHEDLFSNPHVVAHPQSTDWLITLKYLKEIWPINPADPWGDFIERAQEYTDSGQLDAEETTYKLEIGRKLATVRALALSDPVADDDWREQVKQAINDRTNNLINARFVKPDLIRWFDEHPDDALSALRSLWAPGTQQIKQRIQAMATPLSAFLRTKGAKTNVASVLLMGLDAKDYPPYRATPFDWAYEQTGYPKPDKEAEEGALYEHALGFLDRFIDEAGQRGLTLPHRLAAQSVVWALSMGRVPPPPPPPDLQSLAEELYFEDTSFLEEIIALLKDKKQVIFHGPPGTGKTYVARELAEHLAGSKDRVRLVQFHPSYAYEDFVQGFRPVELKNEQAGFRLKNGPLLQAADYARNEPDAKHFLVIDEINRGNLAKVFGELYFLLEYRNEEIHLQYQEEDEQEFSLPPNLYIIGTMNTADRSIARVDLALRRRFYFVEFHPEKPPVEEVLRKWLDKHAPDMRSVADIVDLANKKLSDGRPEDRHAAIGPSYFMRKDEYGNPSLGAADVERIWEHSVLPYIEEHLYGQHERLGDFNLSRLRKELDGEDAGTDDDGGAGNVAG